MFNKILVAVDGSEHSKKAARYALELAENCGGKITLIHVYSRVMVPPGVIAERRWDEGASAELSMEADQTGHQILDEAEQIFKGRNISVEKVLRQGEAVKEIVTLARAGKFDLVVVGHRGLGKFRELVLGSVSEGVSHQAPCPVMIVK